MRKGDYLICCSPHVFPSLAFLFQMGKARGWEKWLLGSCHSQRPQRLPGGIVVSPGPTSEWTSSALHIQPVSIVLGGGDLKMQPQKGNLQGNHSLPVMLFRATQADWLLIGKHCISMFNYTQKLVLWGGVSTFIKLRDTHVHWFLFPSNLFCLAVELGTTQAVLGKTRLHPTRLLKA